jgi:hypothetical protein
MRLSITLDDDVYALAKSLAQAEDITVGAAVNRLVRKGVAARPSRPARSRTRNGVRVSAGRAPVTAETVRRVEHEDDLA